MKTSCATRLSRRTTGTLRISALLTRAVLVLLGSLFGLAVSFAQVDAGAILGTVRDTSNAVIPGVKVTLTNEDTGISQATTSRSTGEYCFPAVRIDTSPGGAESRVF